MISFNCFNKLIENVWTLIARPNVEILTEQKVVNQHSTHVEEIIFTKYKQGLDDVIEGLTYIIKNIGHDVGKYVSKKVDGAPAVFCLWVDGKFAVASKSIFNKNPKLNFTEQDIDQNHPAGLASKLKYCLRYLKDVVPNNGHVYQGDLLYTEDDLKTVSIEGRPSWMFHPNTIAYTVGKDTNLGKRIAASKLGISMHTEYEWDQENPSTLSVSRFGVKDSIFKHNVNVFLIDTVSDLSANKNLEFTQQEYVDLNAWLEHIKHIGSKLDWTVLSSHDSISVNLMTFINTYIRENVTMPNPQLRAKQFADYIRQKYNKEMDSKKTERGKAGVTNRYQPLLDLEQSYQTIEQVFEIFDYLTKVKLIILRKLNDLSMYDNFIITANGDMVHTGEEGFVISQTSIKGAKLVDRYTFSRNNFSKDVVKGWSVNR